MEPSAARQLAIWFFPSWATWGEAGSTPLVFPDQDGRVGQWSAAPHFWGGGGAASQASADESAANNSTQATVERVAEPKPAAGSPTTNGKATK